MGFLTQNNPFNARNPNKHLNKLHHLNNSLFLNIFFLRKKGSQDLSQAHDAT